MAVITPFEFPLGVDGWAAPFTHGELLLSPTVDGLAPASTTYYFSRNVPWPAGKYVITAFADDAMTLLVGTNETSMRQVFAMSLPDGTVAGEFYLFEGETRIDVVLHNVGAGGSTFFVCMIHRDDQLVYSSAALDWVCDTAYIADEDLVPGVDPRNTLNVFSLLPNWRDGITEQIGYLTDVMESEDGHEQRRAVRVWPRRSFEAGFLRTKIVRTWLANFLISQGRKQFYVPLWHEQYRVTAAIVGAAMNGVFLPTDAAVNREFLPDDLVLVTLGDPLTYEVAEIATVDAGTGEITWTTPPASNWPKGTRIIPLRKARILDSPTINNLTDTVGDVRIRFALEPDYQFDPDRRPEEPAEPDVTIFPFRPNWAEPVTLTSQRATYMLDGNINEPFIVDPSQKDKPGERLTVLLRGRAQVYQFRRFVHTVRGRAVWFYMPTFTSDLTIAGAVNEFTLNIEACGMVKMMEHFQTARIWIGIYMQNGDVIYRQIALVTTDADEEVLTFTDELPEVITADVKVVRFVPPSRFDQDVFEMHHHVDSSAAVTTQLVTRVVHMADLAE